MIFLLIKIATTETNLAAKNGIELKGNKKQKIKALRNQYQFFLGAKKDQMPDCLLMNQQRPAQKFRTLSFDQ